MLLLLCDAQTPTYSFEFAALPLSNFQRVPPLRSVEKHRCLQRLVFSPSLLWSLLAPYLLSSTFQQQLLLHRIHYRPTWVATFCIRLFRGDTASPILDVRTSLCKCFRFTFRVRCLGGKLLTKPLEFYPSFLLQFRASAVIRSACRCLLDEVLDILIVHVLFVDKLVPMQFSRFGSLCPSNTAARITISDSTTIKEHTHTKNAVQWIKERRAGASPIQTPLDLHLKFEGNSEADTRQKTSGIQRGSPHSQNGYGLHMDDVGSALGTQRKDLRQTGAAHANANAKCSANVRKTPAHCQKLVVLK